MINLINRMFCMPFIMAIMLFGTPILVMADFMDNVKSTLGDFRKTIEDTVKTKDTVKKVVGQVLDNEKTLSAKTQDPLISDKQLKQYNPSIPNLSSINMLAPSGISIGMPMKKAKAKLAEAGYKYFRIESNSSNISLQIKEFDGVVQTINYFHNTFNVESSTPAEIIERATKKIGTTPNCMYFDQRNVMCTWTWPPSDPLVKSIRLQISETSFTIKNTSGRGTNFDLLVKGVNNPKQQSVSGSTNLMSIGDTIDPLKPEGISIGMFPAEVWPILKQNEFRKQGRCEFKADRGESQLSFKIQSGNNNCPDEKAIRSIQYDVYNFKVANSILDFVKRMNQQLGVEPTRCIGLTEFGATCIWDLPPVSPLVQSVNLQASKTDLSLGIKAVGNLDVLVTATAPPPTTREMTWWERELSAKLEAPLEISNSLRSDVSNKVRSEAQKVYEYCKKRQLFSSFNDCGCVAQKFVNKRAEQVAGWQTQEVAVQKTQNNTSKTNSPVDYTKWRADQKAKMAQYKQKKRQKEFFSGNVNVNSLISIADKAAAGECPNKAGSADYAYKQCVSQYQYKLQDNVDVFCNCYADRFSNLYMKYPTDSSMPRITKIASSTLTTCSKEISPNPLNM